MAANPRRRAPTLADVRSPFGDLINLNRIPRNISMNRLLCQLLLLSASAASRAQQPPLLAANSSVVRPRNQRRQISPTGAYIAFLEALIRTTRNIWDETHR